jgi:hypothetical protein
LKTPHTLSNLLIVAINVTPHRFIFIRSGMRIPSTSMYQPPATDPQHTKNDDQSDPWESASYHDNLISVPYEAEAAGVFGLSSRPFHWAAFLNLAQRAFCAAAILARASALNARRFLGLAANCAELKLFAWPLPDVAACRRLRVVRVTLDVPVKSVFASCSRAISASILRTMSFVFMNTPSSG